jgi:hypothetical protein
VPAADWATERPDKSYAGVEIMGDNNPTVLQCGQEFKHEFRFLNNVKRQLYFESFDSDRSFGEFGILGEFQFYFQWSGRIAVAQPASN